MRIIFLLSLFSLAGFFACSSKQEKSIEALIEGRWEIVERNKLELDTREGYIFAPNHQYFDVDSQGKVVPRLIEKIWKIDGDTLLMIDYNWEPEFIAKNGTKVFLIEKLNEEELQLKNLKQGMEEYLVFFKK